MKQENVGINSSLSRMPALVRESVNSLQPAINLVSFRSWSKTKEHHISWINILEDNTKTNSSPNNEWFESALVKWKCFCQIRPQFNGHLCTFGQNPPHHHHSDHHHK